MTNIVLIQRQNKLIWSQSFISFCQGSATADTTKAAV